MFHIFPVDIFKRFSAHFHELFLFHRSSPKVGLYVTVPSVDIFIPLALLFTRIWGLKGLIYTAPVADFIFVVGITLITTEMRKMREN